MRCHYCFKCSQIVKILQMLIYAASTHGTRGKEYARSQIFTEKHHLLLKSLLKKNEPYGVRFIPIPKTTLSFVPPIQNVSISNMSTCQDPHAWRGLSGQTDYKYQLTSYMNNYLEFLIAICSLWHDGWSHIVIGGLARLFCVWSPLCQKQKNSNPRIDGVNVLSTSVLICSEGSASCSNHQLRVLHLSFCPGRQMFRVKRECRCQGYTCWCSRHHCWWGLCW